MDNELRFSLLCQVSYLLYCCLDFMWHFTFVFKHLLTLFSCHTQAALEAPRVLNLNCSKSFSGPYGNTSQFRKHLNNHIYILVGNHLYFSYSAGEDVLFIANDWHTALIPCYLKSMYQSKGIYMNAKVKSFCIHLISLNPANQEGSINI